MRCTIAGVVLGLLLVPLGAASSGEVPLRPCTLAGQVEARCGTFVVPERRAAPAGRTISLRLAVLPARDGGSQPDPLVYVAGGPGGSAVDSASFVAAVFGGLNEARDIVLVDQRGTGGSNRLLCPRPARGRRTETPAEIRSYVRSCLASADADPRAYTSTTAMDDLAEVLRALGYDQVNLYGGSYGATAVQYFLAQHPDLARTAILDGGTLLDVPLFELWGRNGHRAMQRILGRCAASGRCARAYPRVRRELFEVLAAVRRAPVRVDGATVDAAAAAETFQWLSRSPEGAAQIPWIAHRARLGDWTPFALARDAQAAAAGPDVQRLLMTWSIRCNEPWARMSPARTAAASSGTYLAEWTARTAGLTATVCSVFPRVRQPGWARTGIRSEAPVLVVAGGADPQDPPANMAGAGRQLANSRTVVVPAAGHGAVHLGCVPRVARSFVERGTTVGLDTRCAAAWRPPPFVAPG